VFKRPAIEKGLDSDEEIESVNTEETKSKNNKEGGVVVVKDTLEVVKKKERRLVGV
jgi:hypothetical protein